MFKSIKVIACCDKNNGIGINNELPWKIKEEMNIFKNKTIGNKNNCVIMGKNTYLSIPKRFRPLNDRINCVITKDTNFKLDNNILLINNLDEEFKLLLNNTNYDEYWIIGGEILYKSIIEKYSNLISEIHISIIDNCYNCNKFFPEIDNTLYYLKDSKKYSDSNFTHYVYISRNKDCL